MPEEFQKVGDRLTFEIGRVARLDVELEAGIRNLWVSLIGTRNARLAIPRGMGDLFNACAAMMRQAGLEGPIELAAQDTLKVARAAHESRNSLVHERWIYEPTDGTWARGRSGEGAPKPTVKTSWSLSDFQWACDELNIAIFRIAAAEQLSSSVGKTPGMTPLVRPRWEAILRGEFRVTQSGGAVLDDARLAGPL